MMRSLKNKLMFAVFILLGLYLLNKGIQFLDIPESIGNIDKTLVAISGILLILRGLRLIGRKRRRHH